MPIEERTLAIAFFFGAIILVFVIVNRDLIFKKK